MNSKKTLVLIALVTIFALSSCSGLKTPCTNCNGGGNANLSITISDRPPANTTVVSFTLPIIGITLTPSSGSTVSVFSSNPSTNFELTRLQSDTNLIVANQSVTAGTYTAVNVTVAAPSGFFVNASNATVGACVSGAFCGLAPGNAATITYTFTTPLALTANANQWLNLDFNYNNAIVNGTNALGIDVTQTGVMTASTTVPAGVPSGNFANIDDFTGVVTAISSSSVTVESSLRGGLTTAISSATHVYDPQNQCTGGASLSCIAVGSIVSLQAALSNAGVVAATSLDIVDISTKPSDEVEGIIYPSNCNGGPNFGMILTDSVIFTSGSPLISTGFGSGVCLTLSQVTTFAIDTGILTTQPGVPLGNTGFLGSGDLLTGQTVRAKVTGATSGANGVNANATALILRFSRLTGTVATSGTVFTINNLPTYLGTFSVPPQVATYVNATLLEGVTDPNSLVVGNIVSINALYLDTVPTFQAAKVRAF